MEAAKRLVLIDERILESLYSKQDSNWRKPTDQVAKSKLNRQMKTDLDDGDIPEDVKVKKYNQDLTKFLHTKRKIPNETTSAVVQKELTASVEENKTTRHIEKSPAATPVSDELVTRRKPVKRLRRALASPLNLSRLSRPKRVRKAPIKFVWEGW
jgi:ATP-dependent protease HslVU (ClpYQ) ATPase subunit